MKHALLPAKGLSARLLGLQSALLAALVPLTIAGVAGVAGMACEEKPAAPSPVPSATAAPAPEPALSAPAAPAPRPAAAEAGAEVAPDAIAAQHILVAYRGAKQAPAGVTRSKADAKKRAEEVVAKCRAPGADFSALVVEYSDDPGSKERMGSLGKFTREKMTKPFSDAAFALKVDGVSDAVETAFGYHVIKRNQ